MKGLFISGSGTNVGKTFIATRIIQALNAKFKVVARKPIESGCQKTAIGLVPKDAIMLNNACRHPESIDRVCKYQFAACHSGEKAATDQGKNLTLNALIAASQPIDKDDFVVIEGAGGLYSPIATTTLNSDLAQALGLPIVIVVADELGAINQALLSLRAAKQHNLEVLMLVLNQITPNDLNNAEGLKAYSAVEVVVFNKNCEHLFAKKVLNLPL